MNAERRNLGWIIALLVIVSLLSLTFVFGAGYYLGNSSKKPSSNNNNQSGSQFTTLEGIYNVLATDFYYGQDNNEYRSKLIEDAIKGMVSAQNDPFTEYLTPEDLSEFTGSLESSFVGIGITYTQLDGKLLVVSVVRSSPAEKAGILSGDLVVAVDGDLVSDIGYDEVVNRVRGKKGTEVIVTVLRDGKQFDISVIRDDISNTVFSEYLGDGVGLLEITSFADGTGAEIKNHLDYLKDKGTKRLIIDLRDNGGGYVTTLDEISSYFMDKGDVIMREFDRDGNEIVDTVKKSNKYEYEKIVVLTNYNSASCSEVFTMALKENCGAITVGEATYGKGVAQVTRMLKNGGAIKYTDLIWKSPNGVFIGNGEGIKPDYEVMLHPVLYEAYLTLEDNETYSYDCVSEKIAEAQLMLDFLNYKVDRTDGYFDQSTLKALQQFETDHGFVSDGILNSEVVDCMNSSVVSQWSLEKDIYDYQMLKAIEVIKQ